MNDFVSRVFNETGHEAAVGTSTKGCSAELLELCAMRMRLCATGGRVQDAGTLGTLPPNERSAQERGGTVLDSLCKFGTGTCCRYMVSSSPVKYPFGLILLLQGRRVGKRVG